MKSKLHEEIRVMHNFGPAACGTTGTGLTGKVIDRKGYNGVEFVFHYGTCASTTETIAITLLESDSSTTGFTSVADSNLAGTEALASLPAVTRTSGTGAYVAKRLGYLGNKRYLKTTQIPTGTATCVISGEVILYSPTAAPTSNP